MTIESSKKETVAPEAKTKPAAKSELPVELPEVARLRSAMVGLTPHEKRVMMTEAIRRYAGEYQSQEYVQLNLLAIEAKVVF